jgi:hypothetical protein
MAVLSLPALFFFYIPLQAPSIFKELLMKFSKLSSALFFGILAAPLPSGCFSPDLPRPSMTEEADAGDR